ncbi:hypothetical protein [Enterococcus sp. DIV0187]|uniref:hypothetical protein n=1 Tax=Enterococcus sp. DIV0187 TaxID=2774644 RepID=UPI003F685D0E
MKRVSPIVDENIKQNCLDIGDVIEADTIDGSIESGRIEAFGERTVIISRGTKRFVIRKTVLIEKGYSFPKVKRNMFINI